VKAKSKKKIPNILLQNSPEVRELLLEDSELKNEE